MLLSIFAGITAGIFTGLIPGIHINLISSLILTLIPTTNSPHLILTFIIALSITHTFLDSIPSIFFGAPNESMIHTALPGHKLFLEGKAYFATILTIIGSTLSIIFAIALSPILIIIFKLSENIKFLTPYIIITIIIIIILNSKNKLKSTTTFIISGLLGLLILNLPIKNVLLPSFSGFFGVSGLILSLKEKQTKAIQKIQPIPKLKEHIKPCFIATLIASIAALLPGLGSSHSAILTLLILKDQDHFLSISGAINTANMAISAITYYTLQKARNGSIIAISNYFPQLATKELLLIFITILFTASVAIILSLKITSLLTKTINKINYQLTIKIIIAIIILITAIITKLPGILILILTTSFGIIVIENNIARNNMLGFLIIPTLTYLI